ncbi:reverse transcriptase domain-containing protein [Tanacetum coccineum]
MVKHFYMRNKETLENIAIAITTVNAECSAIILNKVPEKLEDPGKFLIPCALQELDRTNALADSGASINLLPHSIYKQLGLGALKPTRMTLELANRSVTHPMGIAEDVVVRVDGFTFLADFVVVNFEPDPRVPIILGRPFLRTAKALIDLYEEKLTLRVGSDELVFYAEKSEKSKNKQFAHAISVIDFSKDEPFSGSTTNHSDALPPSSSPVKTSEILEEFADELTLLKKGGHEENFQVYSNPLFEFDDNFTSSNVNPLFNEMVEDVENENSNVSNSDEPVLLNTPLSDKVECSDPEDEIDEIDTFLAMEVSSNFEEGYFDSEGDIIFLENLLSDDTTHNLAPEVITDHEPNESIQNTSITFSPRSDPLHHEFASELLTLPSRIAREHEEYLSHMTLLYDLIPPGVKNDDSKDEDNELPNLDHQDNPSSPRPPPEPPDVCLNFKPDTAMKNDEEIVLSLNVEDVNSFTFVIWTFLPFFTYPEDSPVILSLRSTDKAKTIRKRLKPGKHEHKERKSTKEAGNSKPKSKSQPMVKPWSTQSLASSNAPHWSILTRKATLEEGKHKALISSLSTLASVLAEALLNGRRAYNGRAPMDFYWLISDKPELLISSFEHFSFCLAEALSVVTAVTTAGAIDQRPKPQLQVSLRDKPALHSLIECKAANPNGGFGLGDILKPELILPLMETLSLEQVATHLPEGEWTPEDIMELL